MTDIQVILFDLGGVLIELGESPFDPDWVDSSCAYTTDNWFQAPANISFDKGLISADQFSRQFKQELKLNASAEQIREHFRNWPLGPYQGVRSLLQCLRTEYRLALLTNTNALHWPRIVNEFEIVDQIDSIFASHELAMIKPETGIYQRVLEQLQVPAASILFFDDNQNNVAAAQQQGMRATQVKGFDALLQGLQHNGISWQ